MSIIINGVDKPNRCRYCPFCIPTEPDSDDSPYECVINIYLHWATWLDVPNFISERCKISGIPTPHGDLIDRDKLIQLLLPIMEFPEDERIMRVDSFIRMLKNAPTIIEAEQGDG